MPLRDHAQNVLSPQPAIRAASAVVNSSGTMPGALLPGATWATPVAVDVSGTKVSLRIVHPLPRALGLALL